MIGDEFGVCTKTRRLIDLVFPDFLAFEGGFMWHVGKVSQGFGIKP